MEVSVLSEAVDTTGAVDIAAVEVVGSIVVVVFATVALVDKKSVVDIVAEMVCIDATVKLTPRMYFVVAIVAVDILGLMVVALIVPLST